MCCETCPEYEECAAKNRLKDDCCKKCPDYEQCYERDFGDEDYEDRN